MDHSSDHSTEKTEAKHGTEGASAHEAGDAQVQAVALAKKKKLIKVLVAVLAVSGIVAGGSYAFLKSTKSASSKHLAQNGHGEHESEDSEEEAEGDGEESQTASADHMGAHGGHAAPGAKTAQGSHDAHGGHGATGAHGAPGAKTAQGSHDAHGAPGAKTAQGSHDAHSGHGAHGTQDGHRAPASTAHDAKNGWLAQVQGVWGSIQTKADRLRFADEENERLRLENANLRLKLAAVQYDRGLKLGVTATNKNAQELQKQGGARTARTPASITYRPPVHLLPSQLLTLGVSYFRGREDEKAAVIFTFLVDQEESESFKVPKNYLLAGVSWYRLDNLELADKYFARVLDSRDLKENLPYHAQARLWRALVAERQNKGMKTQYWMRELVDHHPHALETAWVNTKSPKDRQPAAAAGHGTADSKSSHSGAVDEDGLPLEKKKKKPAAPEHHSETGHTAGHSSGHSAEASSGHSGAEKGHHGAGH